MKIKIQFPLFFYLKGIIYRLYPSNDCFAMKRLSDKANCLFSFCGDWEVYFDSKDLKKQDLSPGVIRGLPIQLSFGLED